MKKFNRFFVLLVVFLFAFVLPIAVLAGKEGKDADEHKAQYPISTEEINEYIDNGTSATNEEEAREVDTDKEFDESSGQGLKKVWVGQKKSLIQEKNALADGLEEAKVRLEQLETEYEAALLLRDSVEIDFLSGCIAIEKSNIAVMNTQMKKTIEEMHKVKEFTKI